MPWLRRLSPVLQPLYRTYARLTRSMTLGVRGAVFNEAGEVLLVEHTYITGWFLPGGGVELGETTEAALARELAEEAGIEIVGRPTLLSVHTNLRRFLGDHMLLYRIDAWTSCRATSRGEILRVGWFALDALPHDTTAATRRQIADALGHPVKAAQ